MDKRYKEILSALIHKLRHLLIDTPMHPGFEPDTPNQPGDEREQAAYTWIIRLLTLRAMEARGLLGKTRQANENPGCLAETLSVLRQNIHGDWRTALKLAWADLARVLPGLFALDDLATTLHPNVDRLLTCIKLVTGKQALPPGVTLEELDATFADPDAIGWAYQFYQTAARARINAKCRNGGKVASRAELVAKTQLFTEPYMVQWLLQNSLGRSYAEAYPQSTLPANWPYYIQPEPTDQPPERTFSLEELTLLDPCMGCGHFLRAAFDLFAALYREQYPAMNARERAERILSQHLFGIDLDPRAAQISALILYLRAWELCQTESLTPSLPPEMHLITIPASLAPGSLQRHLQRYPQDTSYTSQLEQVFAGLEQIDTLGSLLRVREYLDQAVTNPRDNGSTPMTADLNHTRQALLERIAASCSVEESATRSVSLALFGRETSQSINLLQTLDKRYALIATNPPYLDSRDMDASLRKYSATHYPAGKRDLYAAFLLRCFDLCQSQGRVAVITMQSWMFNRSFAKLRAVHEEKVTDEQRKGRFTGILRETCIEALVHLGAHAFEEIMGGIVQCAMFTCVKRIPDEAFRMRAWRLVGLKNGAEKRSALLQGTARAYHPGMSRARQRGFLALAESPIVYYLSDNFMLLLTKSEKLQTIAHVRQGLATADNARFTRCRWEIPSPGYATQNGAITGRWFRYAKGGSYQKWAGLMWLVVDWEYGGQRIKLGLDAHNRPRFRDNAPQFAFQTGLTYTFIASGSFGTRILNNALFDVAGTALFPKTSAIPLYGLAAVTSSHVVSYLLRILTQDLKFNAGYVATIPLAPNIPWNLLRSIGEVCIKLKEILSAQNMIEDAFTGLPLAPAYPIQAVLHTLEGWNERAVCDSYQLNEYDRQAVIAETGTPAGWFPLIAGYDQLPNLADDLEDAPELPQEFYTHLAAHPRVIPSAKELARIKAKLRRLYAAGPRAKDIEPAESTDDALNEEEKIVAGAHIPIPAETFLEGLSSKMQLHPLSVYWLLEELQATEDLHCKPEERRFLEERLSVLVLRLLGHRWPHQIEHFEPLPEWAERGGIIPLVPGTGCRTLAERVREQLNAEEGAPGALELEQRLHALTGQDLEQWLSDSFFESHSTQFKQRPIAWHLTSTPPGREKRHGAKSSSPRTPAFACLLYYHACDRDTLARIRSNYIEPLLQNERNKIDTNLFTGAQATLSAIQERIRELEECAARLQTIEEQGFACRDLQESSATEALDYWSGSGESCLADRATFQRNEAAWQIDINDGVRVNIAPLQLAGILAGEVLKPKDALKALSDRVHWRAEERRWVRAGQLPSCGWMNGSDTHYIPEPQDQPPVLPIRTI